MLEILAAELLVDKRTEGEWSMTWFLPVVEQKIDAKPMTPAEVEDLAFKHEIKKSDAEVDEDLFALGLYGERNIVSVNVAKSGDDKEEEERFILGIVLEPNDGADGAPLAPDTQGDIYSREDIRRAAHGFMEKYRVLGLEHEDSLRDSQAVILESYLAPVAFKLNGQSVRAGTWLLAERILDDDLWKRIKDGELNAYSIGGDAVRTPVEAQSNAA